MSFGLILLVFINLSLVFGIIIMALPEKWDKFGLRVDPSPYYSVFGIFCVGTILEIYNLLTYTNLVILFVGCFPCIFLAYQFRDRLNKS